MALSKILEELKEQRALLEELLVPVRKAKEESLKLRDNCIANTERVATLRKTYFEKRKYLETVETEDARDDLRAYTIKTVAELELLTGCHNYVERFCYPEDTEIKCNIHG
jgi:hypothetical protein